MGYFIQPTIDKSFTKSNYYKNWLLDMQKNYPELAPKTVASDKDNISYSEYNYGTKGIASYIKKQHFEVVLKLTKEYFYKSNVIDFGCADGIFLPSLANYFKHVYAIDISKEFIDICKHITEKGNFTNVELLCNDNVSNQEIKLLLGDKKYDVVYLLEVLEHIGRSGQTMYEDKIIFLKEVADLITKDGVIVISVPKMVGLSYLLQRMGVSVLGLGKEPISFKNLLKAGFLRDTTDMEKQWWSWGHMGFNHLKMEEGIKKEFVILKRKSLTFQMVYVIKRKPQ